MGKNKWPKIIPELTDIQKQTRDDWMKFWHEQMPGKWYGIIENFNHGYPARTNPFKDSTARIRTLEIGAGLGDHIKYEDLSNQDYHCLEIRNNMAEVIRERFPEVSVTVGDIQKRTEFEDKSFDRIIAVHVLEHLPDLPSALTEISRLLKDNGVFQAVIPCEGGLAYGLARQISSVRLFNKHFGDRGVSYMWLMRKTEHVNTASEILYELSNFTPPLLRILSYAYFPMRVPVISFNLCIGLTIRKAGTGNNK